MPNEEFEHRSKELQQLQDRLRREEEKKAEEQAYQKEKEANVTKFFRKYDSRRISHYIPSMQMPLNSGSSKTIVYFHANAEDMVLCGELLDYLRSLLKVNVIAVEYPGYGIYTAAF